MVIYNVIIQRYSSLYKLIHNLYIYNTDLQCAFKTTIFLHTKVKAPCVQWSQVRLLGWQNHVKIKWRWNVSDYTTYVIICVEYRMPLIICVVTTNVSTSLRCGATARRPPRRSYRFHYNVVPSVPTGFLNIHESVYSLHWKKMFLETLSEKNISALVAAIKR